jgi:hypothetical protein
VGGHWLLGTLDLHDFRLTQHCGVLHQASGRFAKHHPTRLGDRLHPLRHPDLLTDSGVTQSARADLTGDHLARVQAHPQLQLHTVAVVDFKGESLGLLLKTQGGQAGANSAVLQRDWGAEHRHDAVAP